jgi:[ribosomal protein S5]-alanine N-acetyltransferase
MARRQEQQPSFMKGAIIECGDLILRRLRPSDKKSLVRYANNKKIWRNVRDIFPHPYTEKDADVFIAVCSQEDPVNNFCIDLEGVCIGMIGFTIQKDVYRKSAEVGYWLGEPFWGKGIATRALQALISYIFTQYDVVRLHAGIFEWNPASMRVLEKAGFKREGIFEKAIFKDGQLIDEHRYSLVKSG